MKKHNPSHFFTLTEIMVASAVLVIMMSFIFEFTNSAQRLWNTNTGRIEMSDTMDVVFNALNDDFENIYVVSPEEELDAQAGWYCMHKKDGESTKWPFANVVGYDLEDLCFFTQSRETDVDSNVSLIHPVRYHFVPGTDPDYPEIGAGKLYRFEANGMTWDKIAENFDDSDRGGDPDWYFDIDDSKWKEYDQDNLIAENLQSFQIFCSAAVDSKTGEKIEADDMPLMEIPQGITVTIITSVPQSLRNNEDRVIDAGDDAAKVTDRAMTRVYMLR